MRIRKFKKVISKCLAVCMTVAIFTTGNVGTLIAKAGQREDVVALARSQVGYHEKASGSSLDDFTANSGSGNYTKYARDLGVSNGQAWCAYFVWWVLQSSGVDPAAYPRSGWVPTMAQWFKNAGLYQPSGGSYVPNCGDIVFFGSGYSHVGMVEYVSQGYVHCIEGNCRDSVRQTSYNLYTSSYMQGFGIVNFRPSDTTKPTVTDVKIIEQTASSYTVQCTATDDVAVARVQFPTWTEKNGQDDITWEEVSQSANGVFTYTVNIANHGNEDGIYCTDIYAHDTSGNMSDCQKIRVTMDKTAPTFSVVEIREMTSDGFKLQFQADDNLTGIQHIGCLAYPTGKESSVPANWYEEQKNFATNIGGNKWEYEVKIADHDNARGSYDVKLLAYDKCNNVCEYVIKEIMVPSPENTATGSVAGDIANAPVVTEPNDLYSGNEHPEEDATETDAISGEHPEDATTSEDITTEEQPENGDTLDDGMTEDVTTAEEVEDITTENQPDNVGIDASINVENNFTTIVNNYISNNTYVQNGVTYAAENVPVLDTVLVADTYEAPQTVYIESDPDETIEQLQEANPESAVSGALTQYADNCVQSAQTPTNAATEEEQPEGFEPTDAVNVLNEIQAESGEKPSISYTTTIDGRKVTFKITLK